MDRIAIKLRCEGANVFHLSARVRLFFFVILSVSVCLSVSLYNDVPVSLHICLCLSVSLCVSLWNA